MKTLIVTRLLLGLLLLVPFWAPVPAQAQLPAGFVSTTVSAGWNEAVGLTFTADGQSMFVWERPGKVWAVANGQRQLLLDITPEVGGWEDHGLLGFALHPQFATNGYLYLLYVVDRHYLLNYGTPDYSPTANDYYSATIGRLVRYTALADGQGGYTVDPASRKILLGATKTTGIPSTAPGHCTNALLFGTDGTLLVSTGDGAHPNADYSAQAQQDGIIRPEENVGALRAQMVNSLSGKVLRLDPETGAGIASNPFYRPADPFAPQSRVWALGFRNPFRMTLKAGTGSADPAAADPGTLYIGDVGFSSWEEVSVVDRPGLNLGWPLFEGLTENAPVWAAATNNLDAPNPLYGTGGCTKQYFTFQDLIRQATAPAGSPGSGGQAGLPNPCDASQPIPASIPSFYHTRPLLDWGHGATGPARAGTFSGSTAGTALVGAAGSPIAGPQFGGAAGVGGVFYPYNDFPPGYQNTYFFGDYVSGWIRNLTLGSQNNPLAVRDFVGSGAVVVNMAVSPAEPGLFYVNFAPSEIRKISYVSASTPPVAAASADKTYGPSPLAVQFTGSASSDPNGGALTYLWNFGDGTTSTAPNPAHAFTAPTAAPVTYAVVLTVRNGQGLTDQAQLAIAANDTPPQVTITSPANNTLYPLTGNTTYALRATVTDAEQSGHLLAYRWQTVLHHNIHVHPDPVDTTRQTSTTIVPYGCGAETYYYTISLTVTDAGGLSTTKEVRLNPNCNTTSLTLVNAETNGDIQALTPGTVLNLATLPTRSLNIRANASPATTGSVVFALSGTQSRSQTESVLPYALFSDNNGAYYPWTPPVGNYSLTATPYPAAGGGGTPGPAFTVAFSVTDSGTPGPYTLTTTVYGSGTITKSPNQSTYPSGTSVALTATPAAGFQFAGWGGAATGTANPLTVTMSSNTTITATFTAVPGPQAVSSFTLVNADTNADIQPIASGATLNLATLPTRRLNIRANTSPATVGSVVFALSGAASKSQTESTAPYALFSDDNGAYNPWTPPVGSYSLTAAPYAGAGGGGTAGAALTVAFSVIDQAATGPFTLAVATSGSGTVAKSPNQTGYPSGTTVTLTAAPATGYQFAGWSGSATGTANPLTVTMNANKSITATFAATAGTYTLTLKKTGSGTVAKSPNQASYPSGTSVSVTATPAAGYQFTGWSGAATGTANPLAVVMTANKTITAAFTAVPQQVTGFTLINADTDLDIQALLPGTALNLATLPTRRLNVRANTSPATVGSVVFALSGTQAVAHTESLAPYALFADSNGDYPAWTPAVGSYTLKATPYTGSSGGGTAGPALSVAFSVADQAARPAAALATLAASATPAAAYPNPSADGRFALRLPGDFRGEVRYRLLSALGATAATGTLTATAGAPAQGLDLAAATPATGVYYLLLENHGRTARLKLLRD